jgi:type I protein arginine methyltransferase
MYSLKSFGDMIADTARFDAYADAISRCVRPGNVVVEIGCGPAVFSLLACRAGARQVYAIDTEDIVATARLIAAANGCADRIRFLQSDSRKAQLPERANVIISDIRGVLPLFNGAVQSLRDAHERFLAPGGIMIPRRDVLKAALVEAHQFYSELTTPWRKSVQKGEFSLPLKMILNTPHGSRVKLEELMSLQMDFCSLDYALNPTVNASAKLSFSANRNGTAHGIVLWFETELCDGIAFSSGPESPVTIYGQLFLPWLAPVSLCEGQKVSVELQANLIGKDYLWRWKTDVQQLENGRKIQFQQNSLDGASVSTQTLRRHATSHVPVLTEEGEADRFLLQEMNGSATLQQISEKAAERFPNVYPGSDEAFQRAVELARRFSR